MRGQERNLHESPLGAWGEQYVLGTLAFCVFTHSLGGDRWVVICTLQSASSTTCREATNRFDFCFGVAD